MAGNIIAAIPAVQLAVKSDMVKGLYVIMAVVIIISGCCMDTTHATADVPIKAAIIAFCALSTRKTIPVRVFSRLVVLDGPNRLTSRMKRLLCANHVAVRCDAQETDCDLDGPSQQSLPYLFKAQIQLFWYCNVCG
jgi:hypothetical protein